MSFQELKESPRIKIPRHTGLRRIWRACFHSAAGLRNAFVHEAAFRQESLIGIPCIAIALFLPVGWIWSILLIGSVLMVLIVELLNTGLEWVVDYISLEEHPTAKCVKDMGSAAVLLSLILAGFVWLGMVLAHWHGFVDGLQQVAM